LCRYNEDVMKTLTTMFPDTAEAPREYKVTRWSQDPFSRGSYSYVPVGAFKADYDRMAGANRIVEVS
jgi:monoamine oxidase